MKVVVTGGAGFIGSAIAKEMCKKHDVFVVDDYSAGYDENLNGFTGKIVKSSVLDREKLKDVFSGSDVVFHLAAVNSLPDCSNDVVNAMDVNIKGTALLLDLVRRFGSNNARFVFTSSSAVYEGTKVLPSKEDQELKPHLAYAVSKLQGELLCRSFYKCFGLPITIIRPFNVYGDGQDFRRAQPPVMCALTVPLLKGKQATIYGDGTQSRDFIHIEDMAGLFILASTHPKAVGESFNGGTSISTSINDMYKAICSELKISREPVYAPAQGLFDKYPELKSGNFKFRDDAVTHEAIKNSQADVSKAKSLLGWSPKVSFVDGIRRSIEYVKKNVQ